MRFLELPFEHAPPHTYPLTQHNEHITEHVQSRGNAESDAGAERFLPVRGMQELSRFLSRALSRALLVNQKETAVPLSCDVPRSGTI